MNLRRFVLARRGGRHAFTLVELMVSMALIVFIMSILSTAFSAASKAFRDLKAAGDMAEKLRGTMTLLRRDLAAPHFDGTRKLSQPNFWGSPGNYAPPPQGFVRIYQPQALGAGQQYPPGAVSTLENVTFVSTGSALHFTVALPGAMPIDFFSTLLPDATLFNTAISPIGNQENRYQPATTTAGTSPFLFRSQFAEVAYWLLPSPPNPDGTPLVTAADLLASPPQTAQQRFTLYRRVRLLWPEGSSASVAATAGYDEVSLPALPAGPYPVNGPVQVANPAFRFGMGIPATYSSAATPLRTTEQTYAGQMPVGSSYPTRVDDILLTDVLSFDVRILLDGDTVFRDLFDSNVQAFASGSNPQYTGAGTPRVFDTWCGRTVGRYSFDLTDTATSVPRWQFPGTNASIPLFLNTASAPQGPPIRIRAIQVTLRIWDMKTQASRQMTMVQDL